jgi:serpin B
MTAAGARAETLDQMRRTLHHTLPAGEVHAALGALSQRWNRVADGFTLATANRLFGHTPAPFEAPFLALTRDQYGAPLERVDFAQPEPARAHINRWVAQQTRDKIPELLPARSIDSLTRLVLVNALYLDARWQHPFEPGRTRPEAFHGPAGDAQVPMMHATRATRSPRAAG